MKGRAAFHRDAKATKNDVHDIGTEAAKTDRKMRRGGGGAGVLSKGLGGVRKVAKLALLGVAGLAAGVVGVFAVAQKSANKFKAVAGEVNTLKRFTGATAEDASKLRYAAKSVGLDANVLAKGLGLFNKNLAGKGAAKFAETLDKMGVKTKGMDGKLRPSLDILTDISEQFHNMPDGPEKTAKAMELFGKSGTQLLPFLNKGKEGLAETAKEAEKLGLVLGEKDLDAMKASNKASRAFSLGMEGLQVQIGRYVLPAMTAFVTFLADKVPGAVQKVVGFIGRFRLAIEPAVQFVRTFLAAFLSGKTEDEGTPVERAALRVREAFLKVKAVFTTVVKSIQGFFRRNPKAMWAGIAVVIGGVVVGAIVALASAIWAALSPVILVVAAIALLVVAVMYAWKRFSWFRTAVLAVKDAAIAAFTWFQVSALPVIKRFVAAALVQLGNLVAWFRTKLPAIREAARHVFNALKDIVGAVIRVLSYLWDKWGSHIISIVSRAFNTLKSVIGSALQVIRGVIDFVLAVINGDWGKAWDALKSIVDGVWDALWATISLGVGTVKDLVLGLFNTLSTPWDTFWEALKAAPGAMWDGLVSGAEWAVNKVIDFLNTLNFSFTVPDIPGVPHRGEKYTIGISDIPHIGGGSGKKGGTQGGGSKKGHAPPEAHSGGTVVGGGATTIRPEEETIKLPRNAVVKPLTPGERYGPDSDQASGPLRPVQLVVDGKVLAAVMVDTITGKAARQ